jgi:hypothetical protein
MISTKTYIFVIKGEKIITPDICVNCLRKADTTYPVVKGTKERFSYWNLPYCNICKVLSTTDSSKERLVKIIKYIQFPFTALLSKYLFNELAETFLSSMTLGDLCGIFQWILILTPSIILYKLLDNLGIHLAPAWMRTARAYAYNPARLLKYPGNAEKSILCIRNKEWADVFGRLNHLQYEEGETPFIM